MKPRRAVRAVFLTPEGLILLMKMEEPCTGHYFWITPGGAIEEGESPEVALGREVEEETGLPDIEAGPVIWTRDHQFRWDGQEYSQREAYYLVETARVNPHMDREPAPDEWSAFRGFRWWSAEEIRTSQERFGPRHLAILLQDLIDNGPPKEAVDAGD